MWETTGDGLVWCFLISCLESHSGGTHSLQRICEWCNDIFLQSVLLKNKLFYKLFWVNYVIPLYQCQNSKGRKFGKQEFRRCRDHQLDSDWCSVIFDVAGEPVQRRLQPLHALLERTNHWLRKLTTLNQLCSSGVVISNNASRSPMTTHPNHILSSGHCGNQWEIQNEQLINVKLMSDLLTFWFYNFVTYKIGLAFVVLSQSYIARTSVSKSILKWKIVSYYVVL